MLSQSFVFRVELYVYINYFGAYYPFDTGQSLSFFVSKLCFFVVEKVNVECGQKLDNRINISKNENNKIEQKDELKKIEKLVSNII